MDLSSSRSASSYDAVLVVSFGGPEGMADVMPFLGNVLRGRNVPEARMREVAHHYELFGGVSPINQENRSLVQALELELKRRGHSLPVYWGNRNWHPFLEDTVRRMAEDGVQRALAFVTSAYSCYSGCRQYREDIARARDAVGAKAPGIDKLRVFFNHPNFVEANQVCLSRALEQARRGTETPVLFTAHSLPLPMARASAYEQQLLDTCECLAGRAELKSWKLAFQSRSGSPSQPWLGPDVCEALRTGASSGWDEVVVDPIGFICDHMEVIYDLDREAQGLCEELGVRMIRARTVGQHPVFVSMVADLVEERMRADGPRPVVGGLGAWPDVCAEACCLPG